jgi:hypothetical protein
VTTDACEFSADLSLEARCVRCRVRRATPDESELTLQESGGDSKGVKASCVVVTPAACECGEYRVRVRAKLEFG